MELVYPYSGIGSGKVSVIDLHTGVVVPEPNVGDGNLDDGYEPIVLAQAAFVELCHLIKRYVQAAPEAAIEIGTDYRFPSSVLVGTARMEAVIGTKKYVLGSKGSF
jgi:hypothetical protein